MKGANLAELALGDASLEFPSRAIGLHAMLGTCGRSIKNTPDYRWHGLSRGHIEFGIWQYTISGRGELEFEGVIHEVGEGQAMLLHIPHDHCYYLPQGSPEWQFLYINFHGSELLRIWRDTIRVAGPVANFAEDSDTLRLAREIFLKNMSHQIKTPQQASAMAYNFLMSIIDDILPASDSENKPPPFLDAVTEFSIRHLHEDIGVADLADAAGFSRFHFSRVFKAWYGEGPSRFLHDLRMKRAVRLLQTERAAIKDIADQCGFKDPSYFCKVFRKEYGISPEKFRK